MSIYLAAAPGTAWAVACVSWDETMEAVKASGLESKAFAATWAAGPGHCTGWHLDHYELHRTGDQSDSDFLVEDYMDRPNNYVAQFSPSTYSATNYVHRSLAWFRYRIYACGNASCSRYYGDGTNSGEHTSNRTDHDTTEIETWELRGITGETDLAHVILNDPDCLAAHAFIYPASWDGGTLNDKLALYYGCAPSGEPSQIWYMLSQATNWPAGGFNTDGNWNSPILVAKGSETRTDADYGADHPWAMITRDGSTKGITLFMQSQQGGSDTDAYHDQIVWVASEDVNGTDYGGGCGDTGCTQHILEGAAAGVAIAADGTSGTDYIDDCRHMRILWDYVMNPYLDVGVDTPFMLYQLDHSASEHCEDLGGTYGVRDDIGFADAAWSDPEWVWTPETDGGSPYDCPVSEIVDGHDNTGVPLPNAEWKVYYKAFGTDDWRVRVWTPFGWATWWTGSNWTIESPVDFLWNGLASGGPDDDCIEDFSSVLYARSGVFHEGGFFTLLDSDKCSGGTATLDGLDEASDGNSGNDTSENSLVYVALSN